MGEEKHRLPPHESLACCGEHGVHLVMARLYTLLDQGSTTPLREDPSFDVRLTREHGRGLAGKIRAHHGVIMEECAKPLDIVGVIRVAVLRNEVENCLPIVCVHRVTPLL